ncbi:MAG TPA: dienelactone hydrolase family protein [Kineosporiaceae bacterium]|nr:dienelactone hydrolase family protein [Kineosporiaceae bacterium]
MSRFFEEKVSTRKYDGLGWPPGGLHPGVVEFAQRLIDAGYTVFLPSLFGRPGEPFSNAAIRRSVAGVCISREFTILADSTSRVATWLRALAAMALGECDGAGAGVVGMCFTGGFALATALGDQPHRSRTCLLRGWACVSGIVAQRTVGLERSVTFEP